MVMMMAITPSLKASNLLLPIAVVSSSKKLPLHQSGIGVGQVFRVAFIELDLHAFAVVTVLPCRYELFCVVNEIVPPPNADGEPRPEAGAPWTLEAVGSRPRFGKAWMSGSGSALHSHRPPPPNTLGNLPRPSAVSPRSFSPALACQQNPCALLYCICGLLPQDRVAVVANGMRNDGKRVSGHARDLGHHLRCRDEAIGHDGRGHDASLFCQNRIVHTARRAAASIPHRGDDCITALHRGEHRRRCRTAEIGLAQADHGANAILRAQHRLHVVEQRSDVE